MAGLGIKEKSHTDVARWVCIYPAYLNSKKSLAEGRKIPKNKAVENPSFQEIRDVLDSAGFKCGVENKLYPREPNKDSMALIGRIRVQLKDETGGPVNAEYPTRRHLMFMICERIPKLKSRTQKAPEASSSSAQVPSQPTAAKKSGKSGKKGKR